MEIQSTEPILSDDMTIGYILKTYPASRAVFERHGVRCKSCKGAVSEPLRNMAANYGIDLNAFLNELREVVS
ncbi:MAG: disulfide oxidoreductase [Nitrospirota bacterium]|nr:disulfide oxidoreductase [Nitrospirota bacterium]